MDNNLVDFDKVNDLLENDPAYIREFSEAAISSFTTFQQDYRNNLLERDLEKLRKTGHRIKPVAQMVGVEQINREYERAKELIKREADDEEIHNSVDKIETMCDQVIEDFNQKIEQL